MALMWVPGRSQAPSKSGALPLVAVQMMSAVATAPCTSVVGVHRNAQAGRHPVTEALPAVGVQRKDLHPLDGAHGADCLQLGDRLGAGAEEQHPACVGAGQVAGGHAADGAGAHGGQVFGVHERQRPPRAGIVEEHHALDRRLAVLGRVVAKDGDDLDGQGAGVVAHEGGHGEVQPVVGGDRRGQTLGHGDVAQRVLAKAFLHRSDGLRHGEQLFDVVAR